MVKTYAVCLVNIANPIITPDQNGSVLFLSHNAYNANIIAKLSEYTPAIAGPIEKVLYHAVSKQLLHHLKKSESALSFSSCMITNSSKNTATASVTALALIKAKS